MTKKYKDDWNSHWLRYADSASINPAQMMRHETIIREIRNIAGSKKVNTLIDIGSGQGDFLKLANKRKVAKNYVGFELSPSGVNVSKKKIPSATFYKIDLLKDRPLNKFFKKADVIVCSEVLEHLDSPSKFLSKISPYLKDSGILVLTVPSGPRSKYDIFIGHRIHYTPKSFSKVIKNTTGNLDIDKIYRTGFPFFNLYKSIVILRGKSLINDVSDGHLNIFAILFMNIFRFLFNFNIKRSSFFGWQLIAICKLRNEESTNK
jgi:2-polyprenyl-3-methyl-5-hydroxy-6-metoxy-1,4-benzoquinol methylase